MDDLQRTDPSVEEPRNGVSFLSLPPEVRNQIYSLTLVRETLIQISYRSTNGRSDPRPELDEIIRFHFHGPKRTTTALRNLSSLNSTIRKEAQSFFYANNTFKFMINQAHVNFVQGCGLFLEHCGAHGRASLKILTLEDAPYAGMLKHKLLHTEPALFNTFFHFLQQCKTLEMLKITSGGSTVYCAERCGEQPADGSLSELCLGLREIYGAHILTLRHETVSRW